MDEPDEKEIFKGSENRLTMNQTYTHQFQCIYLLQSYPFDTQVEVFELLKLIFDNFYLSQTCSINMSVSNLVKSNVLLYPKNLMMEQIRDMTLFHMSHWDLDYKNRVKPEDGIKMTIVLKRKIQSEMMTTYFPSILLMMITFATTFFKPFFFEAALTVNLTNMLVMTTIFISVMEKLPITSYSKMIDYWLIFCQLVPFTEVKGHIYPSACPVQVIMFTIMELMRDDEVEEVSSETTDKMKTSKLNIESDGLGDETRVLEFDDAVVVTKEAWTDQSGNKEIKAKNWLNSLRIVGNSKIK